MCSPLVPAHPARGSGTRCAEKRISLTVIDRIEQIPQEDCQAGVLLLGASGEWIERQADRAMAQGAHPILLSNRMQEPQHGSYSAVMMDIGDSMRLAVRYLQKLGCRHLALYGCNPYAASDPAGKGLSGADGAGWGGSFTTGIRCGAHLISSGPGGSP